MDEWLTTRLFAAAIAIPVVGLAIFSVIAARRSRTRFTTDGELLMRYSLPMRLFGLFAGAGMPFAVGILLIIFAPKNRNEMFAAGGTLGFLIFFGGWLLLETQYVRVTASASGITYHSPWRKDRSYSWEQIVEVSTFSYMYPLVFRGQDGRKFRIAAVFTCVSKLIKLFRAHLNPSVYAKAEQGIVWSGVRD